MAMEIVTSLTCSGPTRLAPSGINSAAAAVLLIKFDKASPTNVNARAKPTGGSDVGTRLTNHSAKPVSFTPTPKDKPPANKINTSHGNSRISSELITPVIASTMIGINDTTADGMPNTPPPIQSTTVTVNTTITNRR